MNWLNFFWEFIFKGSLPFQIYFKNATKDFDIAP